MLDLPPPAENHPSLLGTDPANPNVTIPRERTYEVHYTASADFGPIVDVVGQATALASRLREQAAELESLASGILIAVGELKITVEATHG